MAGGTPAQVPAAFGDVAVCFSPEEWAELAGWQKDLYRHVMAETFQLLSSLECLLAIPDLLSQLAQGEVPQVGSRRPPGKDEGCQAPTSPQPQGSPSRRAEESPPPPPLPARPKKKPRPAPPGKTPGAKTDGEPLLAASPAGTKPYRCPRCRRRFLGRAAFAAHRRLHLRRWRRPVRRPSGGAPESPELREPPDAVEPGGEAPLPFWPELALPPPSAGYNPWSLGYGPNPGGEFICDQCGWAFPGWEELVTHQVGHVVAGEGLAGGVAPGTPLTADRPYACAQCGKSFRHKPNLLAHRQVHTGERRYQCPACGKAFGSKAYLASHQHIHTGEKPYVCGQCGKSFRHKPNLLSHQKIHAREPLGHAGSPLRRDPFDGRTCPAPQPLGLDAAFPSPSPLSPRPPPPGLLPPPPPPLPDRPFVCPVCAKPFRCKPYLVAHLRIHTGEKPYACGRCPKRFSQKSNLVSHERLHTGEKPYACPLCPRLFSQGSNMRAHQRSHRHGAAGPEGEGGMHPGYPARQIQQPN